MNINFKEMAGALKHELVKLKINRKSVKKDDMFNDPNRDTSNALDTEVDEQIGHQETEMRVKFMTARIIEIKKALTRIKLGSYGRCIKCGNMIETRRLALDPACKMCAKCQKEHDA